MKPVATALAAGLALFAAQTAKAQHMIAGYPVFCNDFRGLPVQLIVDPTLNDVGRATLDAYGRPIMLLNPTVLQRLSPELQLFWYGHECAHHVLGHAVRPHLGNESEADCWAVRTGRAQGWFPPQAFHGLTQMLYANPGTGEGHLPGPQRIQNMIACYNAP